MADVKLTILDISTYQSAITDVNKLKANCDGIILRVGFTGYGGGTPTVDNRYEAFLKVLKGTGIPVGLYYFTLASDEKMVDMETNWVLNKIKEAEVDGFRFTLPIWVDCESLSSGTYGAKWTALTYERRSELMVRWQTNIKNAGYYTGIYAGVRGYHRKPYFVSKSILKDFDKWTAQYNSVCQWDGVAGVDYHMWQYSSKADAKKYGLNCTNTDISECYVDYPAKIKGIWNNTKGMKDLGNGYFETAPIETEKHYIKVTIGDDVVVVPETTVIKIEHM